MKFCEKCGKEIMDEAVLCPGCGCMVENNGKDVTATVGAETKKTTQVALILGIIGVVFAWLFALVGHITSIIGIVVGIKEFKETGKITGLAVSIIGEVCSVLSSIIGAAAMASVF